MIIFRKFAVINLQLIELNPIRFVDSAPRNFFWQDVKDCNSCGFPKKDTI